MLFLLTLFPKLDLNEIILFVFINDVVVAVRGKLMLLINRTIFCYSMWIYSFTLMART